MYKKNTQIFAVAVNGVCGNKMHTFPPIPVMQDKDTFNLLLFSCCTTLAVYDICYVAVLS
jgi:hypothetical protein